ncbi:hypothetical protein BDN72DRAFT_843023, partial [Pluteus cervinus]
MIDPPKVKNATTKDPADGGRMVWTVAQCKQCRPADLDDARVSLDLSSIPTFELSGLDAEMQVGVLGCVPNLKVETREVRSVGAGSLVVFPNQYKSQGNINPAQAAFLLSNSVSGIADDAGPILGSGLGTKVAATFADNFCARRQNHSWMGRWARLMFQDGRLVKFLSSHRRRHILLYQPHSSSYSRPWSRSPTSERERAKYLPYFLWRRLSINRRWCHSLRNSDKSSL